MTETYFEEEEYTSQISGAILRKILLLIKPHWKHGAGFLAAITVVSILDSVFTYLSKQIIDEGIIGRAPFTIISILKVYGVLIIVQAAGVFSFIYIVGILGERIRFDLRQGMFDHLQELSLSYFSKNPIGWLIARVTSDSDRVADLLTWGLLDTTWAAINIVSSTAFMLYINWKLALIVLTMLPLILYVAYEFRKRILLEYRHVRKLNSRITGAYNENITGVRVVKALVREDANIKEFSRLTGDMYRSAYRAAWLSALFLPAVQIISAFAVGAIAWYGGVQAQSGWITVGGIEAFIFYITFMIWPIQDLARVFAELQHAIASSERIFSLLETKPEITDVEGAYDPGSLREDIEFRGVGFGYTDDNPVLADFSMYIKTGETIALVGPTGGGKTTVVNLLCRFYEPQVGKILVGGKDYREFTLQSIQSRVGMVPQTPHLFSGTILENIRYGRLNATAAQVENAARLAGADSFISRLEHGYNEQVGENGNLLSVGQKQLISLARAVLTDPDIFIMDEATSSVDTITETLIQKSLDNLLQNRTCFIIAHRLSTIMKADRILVIDKGKIVETGTHPQLINLRGKYFHLYTNQFGREIDRAFEIRLD